jgi:hypothetical protein
MENSGMKLYSTTLEYQGHRIIVENWIYWRADNPHRKFFSVNAVKAEIDRIENEKPTR